MKTIEYNSLCQYMTKFLDVSKFRILFSAKSSMLALKFHKSAVFHEIINLYAYNNIVQQQGSGDTSWTEETIKSWWTQFAKLKKLTCIKCTSLNISKTVNINNTQRTMVYNHIQLLTLSVQLLQLYQDHMIPIHTHSSSNSQLI